MSIKFTGLFLIYDHRIHHEHSIFQMCQLTFEQPFSLCYIEQVIRTTLLPPQPLYGE